MSFHSVSGPRCLIQVFPLEGGGFSISSQGTPARIITCRVQKDIRVASGNFEIILAPGGPSGVDGPPTWIDVLTCMSTVHIGMQRADRTGVVMIGVITDVSESTIFEDGRVIRTTTVVGKDIGYFWENFSFFTLASQGIIGATANADLVSAFGPGITLLTELAENITSINTGLSSGLLNGNPAEVADNWYRVIMLSLLAHTVLNVGPDDTGINVGPGAISFADAITEFIEPYPNEIIIPYGLNYIESEFTFDVKMKSILEWPQYEVFYATLPSEFPFEGDTAVGADFTIPNLNASSKAVFMGRINPIPVLSNDFGSVDTSKWDVLTATTADSGFIACDMRFSAGEVANVYMTQSSAVQQLTGKWNNNSLAPAAYIDLALDITSLSRFGYRPHWQQTNWLHDMLGLYAKDHGDEFDAMATDVMARVVSWYHPIPLMAHAEVTYPLLPDIFVGSKFSFNPKKYHVTDNSDWTFYIRSVTHEFQLGGPSTTTLGLERGLPTAVYADAQGLLLAVYKGTALRRGGNYVDTGVDGVQFFKALDDATLAYFEHMEQIYGVPQSDINSP